MAIDELFHFLSKRDATSQGKQGMRRKKGKKKKKGGKNRKNKIVKKRAKGIKKKGTKKKKKKIDQDQDQKQEQKQEQKQDEKQEEKQEEKPETENKNDDNGEKLRSELAACEECVPTLARYARVYEGKAGAIYRQFKRINNFEKLRQSKRDKKGHFLSSYNSIFQTLGSDTANPTCDGVPVEGNPDLQPFSGMSSLGFILLLSCRQMR